MTLTLDKMGRVLVPKALRERLALESGDELEVFLEGDGIRLRLAKPTTPLAEKEGVLICASEIPPAAWDLGAFIDEQREHRSLEVGGL